MNQLTSALSLSITYKIREIETHIHIQKISFSLNKPTKHNFFFLNKWIL